MRKKKNIELFLKDEEPNRDLNQALLIKILPVHQWLMDITLKWASATTKSSRNPIVIKKTNQKRQKKLSLKKVISDRSEKLSSALGRDAYQEYLKKFGSKDQLLRIISEAKNGSKVHLSKLIQFDKSWLYIIWVKERILKAQQDDDKDFFDFLSDAVRLKVKRRVGLQSKVHKLVTDRIHQLVLLRYNCQINNENEYYDRLYEIVYKGFVENNDLNLNKKEQDELSKIDLINDENYFKQYCKRHNL